MTDAPSNVIATTKTCRRCGEAKSAEDMKADKRYAGGLSSYCRACHLAATIAWQKANPERVREVARARRARNRDRIREQDRARYDPTKARADQLWRRYRLTPQAYEALLAEQDYRCAICGAGVESQERPLNVDHDHACCPSGTTCGSCVRGLLCTACNSALHAVERRGDWLQRAAAYLNRAPHV